MILDGLDLREIEALYLTDERRPHAGRPWVVVGMVQSVDGSAAVDGSSTALGDDADKTVFRTLRTVADFVLVGAGTIRAEGYGPPILSERQVAWRASHDKDPLPGIAIVTRSLDLPLESRLFRESTPTVITSASTSQADRERVAERAHIVVAGDDHVDLGAALGELRRTGADIVVAEGGPTLNAHLFAAGLVDEVAVTLAPHIVGGDGGRIVDGDPLAVHMHMARTIAVDSTLLCRYFVRP